MNDFRLSALCAGADPEIFSPTAAPGTPVYDREVGRAKAICAECPVRAECLDWALATGDDFTVVGGTTPAERRVERFLRRSRAVVRV